MRGSRLLACCVSSAALTAPAFASETKTYTYDVLGRLATTTTSGTANNGVTVNTTYDPADNRTTYTVTGSTSMAVSAQTDRITAKPVPKS